MTFRKDANGERPLEQRDEQLVLPMRSLDDGIFMHPNQDSITFGSRIIILIGGNSFPVTKFQGQIELHFG